jgi:hypothetical protein
LLAFSGTRKPGTQKPSSFRVFVAWYPKYCLQQAAEFLWTIKTRQTKYYCVGVYDPSQGKTRISEKSLFRVSFISASSGKETCMMHTRRWIWMFVALLLLAATSSCRGPRSFAAPALSRPLAARGNRNIE